MESNTKQDTDIHVQPDRSFKAIRILLPLPIVILAGLYWGHEGVRVTLDTGLVLLIAAVVEGYGFGVKLWVPGRRLRRCC